MTLLRSLAPLVLTVALLLSLAVQTFSQSTAPAIAPAGQPAPARAGQASPVAPPKKIVDVRPVYPADAINARLEGSVLIEARIDTAGNVDTARVLRSIPLLDEAALTAVRQWKYEPVRLNGTAIPFMMTVSVNFSLAAESLAARQARSERARVTLTPPLIGGTFGAALGPWTLADAMSDKVDVRNDRLSLEEKDGWFRTVLVTFNEFTMRFEARTDKTDTKALFGFFGRSDAPAQRSGNPSIQAYALTLFAGGPPQHGVGPAQFLQLLVPAEDHVKPLLRGRGEWQSYEVQRRKGRLTITLNGQTLIDDFGPVNADGWIGFRTQGGRLELRNLQLAPVAGATRPTYYEMNAPSVQAPTIKERRDARYTRDAMAARIEGEVGLECIVDTQGHVQAPAVVKSLYPSLDDQAMLALGQWTFTPGTRDGVPVPVLVHVDITFALK